MAFLVNVEYNFLNNISQSEITHCTRKNTSMSRGVKMKNVFIQKGISLSVSPEYLRMIIRLVSDYFRKQRIV